MWNLGTGIANGMLNYQKGKDDQLAYNQLQEERKQRQQLFQQQISQNDSILRQQQLQIDNMQRELLKNRVNSSKRQLTGAYTKLIDSLRNAQGKMASIKEDVVDAKNLPENFNPAGYEYNQENNTYVKRSKEYNIPQQVTDAVAELNKDLVHDLDGADFINHFLDPKYGTMNNPIVGVKYSGEKDEIIMTQRDGTEIGMNPLMFGMAIGLKDYATLAEQKAAEEYQANSELLFKANEQKLKLDKLGTEINKNNSAIGLNSEKHATEQAKQNMYNSHAALYDKQTEVGGFNPNTGKGNNTKAQLTPEQSKDLDTWYAEDNDKDFYSHVSKNRSVMANLMGKNETQRKDMKEAMMAAGVATRIRQLEGILQTISNTTGNFTADDAIMNKLAMYGVTGADAASVQSVMKFASVLAQNIATDGIKLKSGAAFSEKELGIILNALDGISKGESIQSALSGAAATRQAWTQTTATWAAGLDDYQQKFVLGYIHHLPAKTKSIESTIDKVFNSAGYSMEKLSPVAGKSVANIDSTIELLKANQNNPNKLKEIYDSLDAETQAEISRRVYGEQ